MITDAEATEIAERYGLTDADMRVVHDLADTYADADRLGELFALQTDQGADDQEGEDWVRRSHPARQLFIDVAASPAGTMPTAEDLADYGIDAEHLEEVRTQAGRIAALRRVGDNQRARDVADEAGVALARKVGDLTTRTDPDDVAAQIPRL